jgi:hypothetical protein
MSGKGKGGRDDKKLPHPLPKPVFSFLSVVSVDI